MDCDSRNKNTVSGNCYWFFPCQSWPEVSAVSVILDCESQSPYSGECWPWALKTAPFRFSATFLPISVLGTWTPQLTKRAWHSSSLYLSPKHTLWHLLFSLAHVNQIHRLSWRPGPNDGKGAIELATCSEDGTLKVLIIHGQWLSQFQSSNAKKSE